MQQYLNLLRHVIDNGEEKSDRTEQEQDQYSVIK